MESSKLPILLEDVLCGRPDSPSVHLQNTQKLHNLLKSTSAATLQGSSLILYELSSKGKISFSDFSFFSSYLSKIKKEKDPPNLKHLPLVNSGLKVSTIFHALNKIHQKMQNLKVFAFTKISLAKDPKICDIEEKRVQCRRIIDNVKFNLGVNLQKTLMVWSTNAKTFQVKRIKKKESLTNYQKKEKKFQIVKLLFKKSIMVFEQQAFWRWKINLLEYKSYVARLKEATELSEKMKKFMERKAGFNKLKINALPLWLVKKKLFFKVLKRAELRLFYVKRLKFEHLKNFDEIPEYEEYEIEQEEETRKRVSKLIKTKNPFKKNLRTSNLASKAKENDEEWTQTPESLSNLVLNMTQNSLKTTDTNEKIPLLLSSQESPSNLRKIVKVLTNISLKRKSLHDLCIKKWQISTLNLSLKKSSQFKALSKITHLLKSPFTKIIFTMPLESLIIHSEKIIEETVSYESSMIDPQILKPLVEKSLLFSNSSKIALLKWKNKILSKKISSMPLDALQISSDNYQRSLFSSIFKINKSRVKETFSHWALKSSSKKQENLKQKCEVFIATLNSALSKSTKNCLMMPKDQKSSDEILSNAVVALCKNLLWAKTKVFNTWARFNVTKGIKGKVEEYLLRNLAKYPKMVMVRFFMRWKVIKKNNSRQLFSMIAVLQRIFSSKSKRVFNPPRIIKDADQIMRRTIRKLTHVKDWALRVGIMRWKFFKLISKGSQNQKSVIKALLKISNPTKEPFLKWAENAQTMKYVNRSSGVSKIVQSISKVFRSRYKLLVFKSLISKKRLTLLKGIWRNYSKKYCEDLRLSFLAWKNCFLNHENIDFTTHKNSKVISIVYYLNHRLIESFNIWKQFKEKTTQYDLYNNYRSLRLAIFLERLLSKRLKNALKLITPHQKSVEIVTKLVQSYLNKRKDALNRWKLFKLACHVKKVLDNSKTEQLKRLLRKIPATHIRVVQHKLMGYGNRVKGGIKAILNKFRNRPKVFFEKWKKFSTNVQSKKFLNQFNAIRLKNHMQRLLNRRLLDTKNRVIGDGNKVKGVFKSLTSLMVKKNKTVITKWTKYVENIKKKQILNNANSEKLKNKLNNIVRRPLRDAFNRVVGSGNKVKGALKSILNKVNKKPLIALKKWLKFAENCDKKLLMGQFLSEKRSYQLERVLKSIPNRVIKDTFQRVLGNGDKIKAAFNSLEQKIIKRQREAWHNWEKFVKNIKNKAFFDNLRSERLKNVLTNLPRRSLKDSFSRIQGNGSKIKGAIRSILKKIKEKPRIAFNNWKNFMKTCESKALFDNLRSEKLRSKLNRIPKRTLRDAVQRILGGGDKVKGVVTGIVNNLKTKPKIVLRNWKRKVEEIKIKAVSDNVKCLKVEYVLKAIPARVLKDSIRRIMGNGDKIKATFKTLEAKINKRQREAWNKWNKFLESIKSKKIYDNFRSQKLKNHLGSLIQRRSKDSYQRIVGNGNKVLAVLKGIVNVMKRRPTDALRKWRDFVSACKQKKIMNAANCFILMDKLKKISARTVKNAFLRTSGLGHGAVGALKNLALISQKKLKSALRKWTEYLENIKKKRLFDECRSQKLKNVMKRIEARTLSSVVSKFSSDKHLVLKALLKKIASRMEKFPREVLKDWNKAVNYSKFQKLFNEKRAEMLQNIVKKILSRGSNSFFTQITSESSIVKSSLKNLSHIAQKSVSKTFEHWQKSLRTKKIRTKINSEKILIVFSKISARVLNTAYEKMVKPPKTMYNCLKRIIKNTEDIRKSVIKHLWHRVEKIRTIRKINSAYFVYRTLLEYSKRLKSSRFTYWKNLEDLIRKRKMRKCTTKMMRICSINYEISLWRWKYIVTRTNFHVTPKHSISLKRFISAGTSYRRRLKQFAYFRLIIHYKNMTSVGKMNFPQAIAHISKHSRDFSLDDIEKAFLDPNKSVENISNISTIASGKLSKDEIYSINQVGALEMFVTQLKSARYRKLAWVLASLFTFTRQTTGFDSEKKRFLEQISELRFEKQSLLEDNNTLREHNEGLIENLEKANLEFQSLSLNLDNMRLVRMIRVISKMIESPIAEAFIDIYDYSNI